MRVSFQKRFLKQLSKLPADVRKRIENFVFNELPNYQSISQSGKIEKMHGYNVYYKARFGSYRIGLKMEDDAIIVQVVMDRKDIYKFFP